MEFAKKYFREGNDKEGFDYLYAHYICNEKEGDDLKNKIKWSPGLRHPVLAVRIGIGITYSTTPSSFTGDPQPIGRVKDLPAAGGAGGAPGMPGMPGGEGRRGRGRGGAGAPGMPGMPGGGMPGMAGMGGMPGMGGMSSGPPADGRGMIDYYVGEFGTRLIEELTSRITEGKFGDVHTGIDGPATAAAGGGMPGMPGMPGMMPGMPGAPGGAPGMPAGGMPGAPGNAGGSNNWREPKGIRPGLVALGVGGKSDLEKRAKDQHVDLMFVFEVKVGQSLKTEIVKNTSILKLYAVQKPGDVVFSSASMDAVLVTKQRKEKDKDPVDTEIERAMNALEKGGGEGKQPFVVTDLPAKLTPENVVGRVSQISSSPESEPLEHMVEIRAYKALTLINDQQFMDGIKGLIGPEKTEALFKSDKEDDRKAVLVGGKYLSRPGKR